MKLLYGLVFVTGVIAGVAAWKRRTDPLALTRRDVLGTSKGVKQPSEIWPHGGVAPYGEPPRRLHS